MARRPLNYGRHLIGEDDIQAVVDVLAGDLITQGPAVERFEAELAERVGARYAVAVSSGTAALHIACLASGLASGREGVTSTLSFVASANAMLYCGADARLLDVDPATLNMSAEGLAAHLRSRPETRTVIPVHFSGLAAESEGIRAAAGTRAIVEDGAHGLGGAYPDGRPIGSCAWSDMTTFSFHPVKPITTGEGGAVMTNDPDLARLLRLYRTHGIERAADAIVDSSLGFEGGRKRTWYYEQQVLGFNYRITDIQAALGISQLRKLDAFLDRRREIVARYDDAFKDLAHVRIAQSDPDHRKRSAHHLYIVNIDFAALGHTRQSFVDALLERRIAPQVHYIPIHLQPYHRARPGADKGPFPNVTAYYETCLSLPLFPDLTDEEADYVADTVRSLCRQ